MFRRKATKADEAQASDEGREAHTKRGKGRGRYVGTSTPAALKGATPGKWRIRGVAENLTVSKSGKITAWFLANNVSWSYRTQKSAEALIEQVAQALDGLEEATVHIRVTHRPFPVSEWAQRSWANSPAPDPEYARVLERDQVKLANADQNDKLVFFGVELGKRSALASLLVDGGKAVRARKIANAAEEAETEELRTKLEKIAQVLSMPGLDAYAANAREMDWLLRKSFGLGCMLNPSSMVESDVRDEGDLSTFARQVAWAVDPLADSVEVFSTQETRTQRRYNVIMTLTGLPELMIPEQDEPWIARADRLGFPVEWSIRYKMESAGETKKKMVKLADRVRAQTRHYTIDHNIDPPRQLARQAERVSEIEDEMRSTNGLTTRVVAHVRVAISADTEKEAMRRAERLVQLYGTRGSWARMLGQYPMAKEFVPMEIPADDGAARRMSIRKLAAGVPNAATEWGDRDGISVGTVTGMSKQAAILNLWYGPEHNKSGLIPIDGTLGSGKTKLALTMIWKTHLQGVPWMVLDPSSLMGEITKLPGMRGSSRSINLIDSESGVLNPYALVADPRWEDIRADSDEQRQAEYEREMRRARGQRVSLARDVLTGCLPGDKHGSSHTMKVLRTAIQRSAQEVHSTLDGVLEQLDEMKSGDTGEMAGEAAEILEALEGARHNELPRLFFADGSSTNDGSSSLTDARTTFFGLKGLVAPPEDEDDRLEWTDEQLLYRPILNLAAWACLREVYRRPREERKGLALDEVHEITESGIGKTLVQKSASDSRKHNLAALVMTQNPSGILSVESSSKGSISNLIGAAFLGRTEEEEQQIANCALARLPLDSEYASMFGELSKPMGRAKRESEDKDVTPREFIAKDYHGNVEKIVVDQNHHDEFMHASDSTPTAGDRRLENRPAPQTLDEVVS